MTRFSTMDAQGNESNVHYLDQSRMMKCPNFIMVFDHYTVDSCLCYDPAARVMRSWGYHWNKKAGYWK